MKELLDLKEDVQIESIVIKWKGEKKVITLSIDAEAFSQENEFGNLNTLRVLEFINNTVTKELIAVSDSSVRLHSELRS